MFKKPLGDLKTSAPLRSSDRRKLRQRVLDIFAASPDDGDLLVPDGLLHNKFRTHLDEPGVLYLSPDGNPLWFTIGKDSDELIPSVYTLWKYPGLLPTLSTPAPVIPKLIGGADLMAPGVVQYPSILAQNQLVAVAQYFPRQRGPPLAVGRMAIPGDALSSEDAKGKAVYVIHTWKDYLWDVGKRNADQPPDPISTETLVATTESEDQIVGSVPTEHYPSEEGNASQSSGTSKMAGDPEDEGALSGRRELSPQEVTGILRTALLQAIRTTLGKLPAGSLPIPAGSFYSSHILPNRPAFVSVHTGTPIDIKHSVYKSLASFLKACEKDSLIGLKQTKSDSLVVSFNERHPEVESHKVYRTVGQDSEKAQKRQAREKEEEERRYNKSHDVSILELWKPHQSTLRFFEEAGLLGLSITPSSGKAELYTLPEIKALLNGYVEAKDIINKREQAYVNIGADNVLVTSLAAPDAEFMKREELLKRLTDKMQSWYQISIEGRDDVLKKGQLKPISVAVKIRQGRKACTLITGFEPYALVAEDLASELQHACASSTSVNPLPGKNAGIEVMVQGKQLKAVADLLTAKGVPKKWIELEDHVDKKKK